jgi:hypothetical protein
MTTVADDKDTQDWAEDCDGEGQERAVRDSRDSRVVMMAVAVEDGGGGQWQQRRKTIAAKDNGMQDQAADYNGEGKERVAREGGDSGVAMMATGAEGGGVGQQWWRRMTTATADENSGGWRRRQMMTAREIKRRTTRGKEESGWQITTAYGQPGREHETKIKKSSLRKKTFLSNMVFLVGVFAPAKNHISSF